MLIYFFICIRMGPKNYAQFSNIITYRGPTMEYLSFHLIFLVFVTRFVKIILLKSCILQCSFTAGLFSYLHNLKLTCSKALALFI